MKGSGACGEGVKLERKTVEKNRRIHMKNLCFKLTFLLPRSKSSMTQHDLLDKALRRLNVLKVRVENLKQKLEEARSRSVAHAGNWSSPQQQPQVMIRNLDSVLEINLVCGQVGAGFIQHQVISILQEEGADIVTVSFNSMGGRVFLTIHCQAISARIGLDPERVHERLKLEIVQRDDRLLCSSLDSKGMDHIIVIL